MSVRIRRLLLASAALATVLAASSAPPGPQLRPELGNRRGFADADGGARAYRNLEGDRPLDRGAKTRGGVGQDRRDPQARPEGQGRGGVDARAGPVGSGADGASRLRDRRPVPEGAALAHGPPRAHDPRALLRAGPGPLRAGLCLGDRAARARRVVGGRRPEGLDARADLLRGQARVPARLAPAAGALDPAGRTPVRVRRAEQLSGQRARDSPRRRVVPLRRAAHEFVVLVAGAVQRGLPPRRSRDSSRRTAATRMRAWPMDRRTRPSRSSRFWAISKAWHAASGEREAELEARLERVRRLQGIFTESDDRQAIRADLEERLPALPQGRLVGHGNGAAVRALAGRGCARQSHPSPQGRAGGPRRVPRIAGRPAMPGHRSRPSRRPTISSRPCPPTASTGARSRSCTRTCPRSSSARTRFDLEQRIGSASDYNLLPAGNEVRELMKSRPAAAWKAAAAGHVRTSSSTGPS